MRIKNEITSSRIKTALEKAEMTAKELSNKSGVQEASISQYVNGYHKPSNISAGKMGMVLGVNPLWLMGFDEPMLKENTNPPFPNIHPVSTRSFPVVSSVACGEPILRREEKDLYIDASADIHADFVLVAKGDSMIGARIHNGDYVFVHKQPEVENGEIAAVAIGEEATLKRFYKYDDMIILRPENPEYKEMTYKGSDMAEVKILGKAVAFQSDIK